jgi:hypothetical protein
MSFDISASDLRDQLMVFSNIDLVSVSRSDDVGGTPFLFPQEGFYWDITFTGKFVSDTLRKTATSILKT